MNALFVTGTDTGCGKTAVACALARAARGAGLRVRVVKPIETGCEIVGKEIRPLDALALARAADDPTPIAEVCPYRLRLAAAPEVAARAEGIEIDPERIAKGIRRAGEGSDLVVVEGAGGLLVPIRPGFDTAELVRALGVPILVVARASLGTINHTRLTLEAASRRGLRVAGVVVSHTSAELAAPERANLDLLLGELGPGLLGTLPFGAGAIVPAVDVRALLSRMAAS